MLNIFRQNISTRLLEKSSSYQHINNCLNFKFRQNLLLKLHNIDWRGLQHTVQNLQWFSSKSSWARQTSGSLGVNCERLSKQCRQYSDGSRTVWFLFWLII